MALSEKLSGLGRYIEDMRKAAGVAGLSVGVLHEGEPVYRAHFGVQSVSSEQPPDDQTIYHVGSLSKAFTAAGIALLVDDDKLSWDSRLVDVIPHFHQRDKDVEANANIEDLLAHRMGLGMRANYWAQMEQELLVPPTEAVNVLGALGTTAEFRTTIKYNNWTYSVAGDIIERLSGTTLEDFMRERVFDPLGLKRATFGEVSDANYATSNITLSDGSPYEVSRPRIRSGTVLAGAAGLKSSLDDLLKIYNAMLVALNNQRTTGNTSTHGSPFKQVAKMFSPHNKKGTTECGLGWFLTELPGEIGWIGINSERVAQNPVIARGVEPTPIAYHNGSMPGVLASVHLIPQTRTTIVVLANTLAFADVPDYVGGLILETILGTETPTDFMSLIEEAKTVSIEGYRATAEKLAADRAQNTPHRALEEYEGRYVNAEGNFLLEIKRSGDGLRMYVQGLSETFYDLYHYHYDVFAWDCDRDAEAKRAMFPQLSDAFRKVSFRPDSDGKIAEVWWAYARDEPEGEVFAKDLSERL